MDYLFFGYFIFMFDFLFCIFLFIFVFVVCCATVVSIALSGLLCGMMARATANANVLAGAMGKMTMTNANANALAKMMNKATANANALARATTTAIAMITTTITMMTATTTTANAQQAVVASIQRISQIGETTVVDPGQTVDPSGIIRWRVTFNEAVTRVNAEDFGLANTASTTAGAERRITGSLFGLSTGTIRVFPISTTVYDIQVALPARLSTTFGFSTNNGIVLIYSVTATSRDIRNAANTNIIGTTDSRSDPVGGTSGARVYVIGATTTAPPITATVTPTANRSISGGETISWRVQFSRNVTGFDTGDVKLVNSADLTATNIATANPTVAAIQVASTDVFGAYTVTATLPSTVSGTYGLVMARATGSSGHNIAEGSTAFSPTTNAPLSGGAGFTAQETYSTSDTTAPTITGITYSVLTTVVGGIRYATDIPRIVWNITFSEEMRTIEADDFVITRENPDGTTTTLDPAASPAQYVVVNFSGGNTWSVVAQTGTTGDGIYSIALASPHGIADVSTNPNANGNPLANDALTNANPDPITLDTTDPFVESVVIKPGIPGATERVGPGAELAWVITYNEPVTMDNNDTFIGDTDTAGLVSANLILDRSATNETRLTSTPAGSCAMAATICNVWEVSRTTSETYDVTNALFLNAFPTISGVNNSIVDVAGNMLDRPTTGDPLLADRGTTPPIQYDGGNPRLTSIVTPTAMPTARRVVWTLTFNEPVRQPSATTGVDFALTLDSSTGGTPDPTTTAAIDPASFMGSGDMRTYDDSGTTRTAHSVWEFATVSGGIVTDRLELDLTASGTNTISDAFGNPMVTITPTGTNMNTQVTLPAVDAVAPVATVTRTSSFNARLAGSGTSPMASWDIDFGEPVLGVDTGDFEAFSTPAGRTAPITVDPNTPATANQTYTFTADISGFNDGDVIGIRVARSNHGIVDQSTTGGTNGTSANAYAGTANAVITETGTSATNTFTVDASAPTVVSVRRQTPTGEFIDGSTNIVWRVEFSEPVTGLDDDGDFSASIASASILSTAALTEPQAPITVIGGEDYSAVWHVGLAISSTPSRNQSVMNADVLLLVENISGHGIEDIVGNDYVTPPDNNNAVVATMAPAETYTADINPPNVSAITATTNGSDPANVTGTFTVTFDDFVRGVSADTFTIAGGATGTAVTSETITGVEIATGTGVSYESNMYSNTWEVTFTAVADFSTVMENTIMLTEVLDTDVFDRSGNVHVLDGNAVAEQFNVIPADLDPPMVSNFNLMMPPSSGDTTPTNEDTLVWVATIRDANSPPVSGISSSIFSLREVTDTTTSPPTLSTSSPSGVTYDLSTPVGDVYTITVTLSAGVPDATYALVVLPDRLTDMSTDNPDTTGGRNTLGALMGLNYAMASTQFYRLNRSNPTLTSIMAMGNDFIVEFDRPVMGVTNANFMVTAGTATIGGSGTPSPPTAQNLMNGFASRWLITTDNAAFTTFTFVPGMNIVDESGNMAILGGMDSFIRTVQLASNIPFPDLFTRLRDTMDDQLPLLTGAMSLSSMPRPGMNIHDGTDNMMPAGDVGTIEWTVDYAADVAVPTNSDYELMCSTGSSCPSSIMLSVEADATDASIHTVRAFNIPSFEGSFRLNGTAQYNSNSLNDMNSPDIYIDNVGTTLDGRIEQSSDRLTFTVTFAEPVANLVLGNFTAGGDPIMSTISPTATSPTNGFATVWTLTFTQADLPSGTLAVRPFMGGAYDMAGNLFTGVGSREIIAITNTAIMNQIRTVAQTYLSSTPPLVNRLVRTPVRSAPVRTSPTGSIGNIGATPNTNDTQNFVASVTPTTMDFEYSGVFAVSNILDNLSEFLLEESAGKRRTIKDRRDSTLELWVQGTYSSNKDEINSSTGDAYFLHTGIDGELRGNFILGGLLQLDKNESETMADPLIAGSTDFKLVGEGWMFGPYITARGNRTPFALSSRLAFGGSTNELTFDSRPTISYDTTRFLGTLTLSDYRVYDIFGWDMGSNLDYSYYSEETESFTGTQNVLIPSAEFSLSRLSFGPTFSRVYVRPGGYLTPNFSFAGLLEEVRGDTETASSGQADDDDITGKFDMGLSFAGDSGFHWNFAGYYDGIGSDSTSYGVTGGIRLDF